MAIRLYNFIALLLIATMSAVVSLFIYLFTINFISQGKSLNFVPKDQQDTSLQVVLHQGTIQGKTDYTTPHEKLYYSFIGIPYALPPVGRLRFRDPVPAKNWDDVLDGTESRAACIQVVPSFLNEFEESEDCLYINIFTPLETLETIENSTGLPVMVWIYGGGFLVGAPDFAYFGPDHFLEKDIILVHFSYRLGPFGFLSTEDVESPGNYGLKDQHLALKWVKNNIEFFGGDPNKITIFGQSAGGASVQYQLLYEKNEGLFQGAISQSGCTLAPWAFQKHPRKIAFDFGYAAGLRAGNSEMLLKYLRSLHVDKLKLASARTSLVNSIDIFHGIPFAPTIEHEHEGAFLTKRPHQMLETGKFLEVPYMIGFNSMEIGILEQVKFMTNPLLQFYDFDPKLLLPSGVTDLEAAYRIKDFYFNNDKSAAEKYIEYVNDAYFSKPIIESARLIGNRSSTYLYVFGYEGLLGRNAMGRRAINDYKGAFHGEEMAYLWQRNNLPRPNNLDQSMHEVMIQLWTNFAKYGNPTPQQDDLLQNVEWPMVLPNMTYLEINKDLTVRKNIKEDMMSFWKKIYSRYGRPPYDTY